MYNNIVLDHFTNPRNVGSIENPDSIGYIGNPADGDKITIYIKVCGDILCHVTFKTFGCGAAIAASSMLTVLATGKTIQEAFQITNNDVAEALGGLPPQKLLCSNIAADALHSALEDYLAKKTKESILPTIDETEKTSASKDQPGIQDKNQIQRYLRHIIMPEISGSGQRKLLDTKVVIFSPSINETDVLLNYLAASGIGHVFICLKTSVGSEITIEHVEDLNPDMKIECIDSIATDLSQIYRSSIDFNVIIGDLNYINDISKILTTYEPITTIISAVNTWNGYINLIDHAQQILDYFEDHSNGIISSNDHFNLNHFLKVGLTLAYAHMGTLIAIELIKAKLNLGTVLKEGFYFDLLDLQFINNSSLHEGLKKVAQPRNFKLEGESNTLQQLSYAKVLIIGAGGLGSPVAYLLAKLGIGLIGLIDYDHVEISNLNRQILHTTSKIGITKVESARQALKELNPNINLKIYETAFTRENAMEIINGYDIIIDGLDNLPTRYLLNDACYFFKKPLVEAGVLTYYGQVTTIKAGETPCYRCIFSGTSEHSVTKGCAERGVLGPVPGLIGMLQGVEVIKLLLGINTNLKGKLLLYDATETEYTSVELQKNCVCKLCGENPSILELGEYASVCPDVSKNFLKS